MGKEKQVAEGTVADDKPKGSLTERLQSAMVAGDMRAVIQLAKQIADSERAKERELAEANKDKIVALNSQVMEALTKVADDFMEQITELVGFENAGVAFKRIPCDKLTQCKISMKAVKSGGGGGGSYVRTGLAGVKELLTQFGDEKVGSEYLGGKFADDTWQSAYDGNTDKNFRYAVLKGLRKRAGLV